MAELFVEREQQLDQLKSRLAVALEGTTQLAFIVGEAGSGKTTLLREFAIRAQEMHPNLLVVAGQCNAVTGIADPFLPFRQLLSLLAGTQDQLLSAIDLNTTNVERLQAAFRTTGRALVELAPELVGTFIPGAAVLVALTRLAARERGLLKGLEERAERAQTRQFTIDDSQVCLQFTALLRAISREYPLVIVLDDLHWVDNASAGLLFHLVRELRDSPILLLGTYRPNELVLSRDGEQHPMDKLRGEVNRYRSELTIDLDHSARVDGQRFVDAIIDSEPNRLSRAFRVALFERTEANPLFTIDLLRNMQATGDLIQDEDGVWVESPALDWNELPARVEAAIKGRIGRLSKELLAILEVASIEGKEFTAQVVARVEELRERNLIRILSRELDRQHNLVYEIGERRTGNTILARYTFAHALYQFYLYQSLNGAERREYHCNVAEALESLFADDLDQIVTQLAYHYIQGGQAYKAAAYLLRAGEKALSLSAAREAKALLTQAQQLLEQAQQPRERVQLGWIHYHLGRACYRLTQLSEARRHSDLALSIAHEQVDRALLVRVLLQMSLISKVLNDFDARKQYLDEALPLARQLGDQQSEARALRHYAQYYNRTENRAVALQYFHQALELARGLNDPLEQANTLNSLAINYANMGQRSQAATYYEEAIQLARQHGLKNELRMYLTNLANHYQAVGGIKKALVYLMEAVELARELETTGGQAWTLTMLGNLYRSLGDYEQAGRCLLEAERLTANRETRSAEAHEVVQRGLARWYLEINNLVKALHHAHEATQCSSTTYAELALEGAALARLGDSNGASEAWQLCIARINERQKRLTGNVPSLYYQGFCASGLALLSSDEVETQSWLDEAHKAYREAFDRDRSIVGSMESHLVLLNTLQSLDSDQLLAPIRALLQEAIQDTGQA